MAIFENKLLNNGAHGAIGASAGAHFGTIFGTSNTLKAVCAGGGTAAGVFIANENVIETAVAGGIGAAGPYVANKLGKTDGTKAAIHIFMGALGGIVGAYAAEFMG